MLLIKPSVYTSWPALSSCDACNAIGYEIDDVVNPGTVVIDTETANVVVNTLTPLASYSLKLKVKSSADKCSFINA